MGMWCDCTPIGSSVAGEYRVELARVVIEFAEALKKPIGPDVAPMLVQLFDVTIGSALASGLSWEDGRHIVTRHIRQIARRAEALAIEDGADTVTAFDVNQAFNEILEQGRAAERRLKTTRGWQS